MPAFQIAAVAPQTDRAPRHGRHTAIGPDLIARVATDRQTRQDAFALRHASYMAKGHIGARDDGLFCDPFDDAPNCQTIVIYKSGDAVASARICVLDSAATRPDATIPAMLVFPAEISDLLAAAAGPGKRPAKAVEINRLVRHPDFADDTGLVFALFRLGGYMIVHHDADVVISCVRRNHVSFYQRLGFESVAGPRTYHGVRFATNLMACFRSSFDSVRRRVPLLDVGPSLQPAYEALFRGGSVPVFKAVGR